MTLSWIPAYPTCVTYGIEELTTGVWETIDQDITLTTYEFQSEPCRKHEYRIRAVSQYGTSEPSESVLVDRRAGKRHEGQ